MGIIRKNIYGAVLIFGWVLIIISAVGNNIIGRAEGKFFPVVTPLQILETDEINKGIEISGTFDKIRDCDFDSIDAYLKKDGHISKLSTGFEVTDHRQLGNQHIENLYVNTPKKNIPFITGTMSHNCNKFYSTITTFIGQ